MNCPSEIVLDAEDIVRPSQAINRVFTYWRKALPGRRPIPREKATSVVEALAPTFSLVRSVRQALDEREAELVQLTHEQARVVQYLDEQTHAAVHGAAGTGKTMVALEKARRLASQIAPVLFLCYNLALKEYLQLPFEGVRIVVKLLHRIRMKEVAILLSPVFIFLNRARERAHRTCFGQTGSTSDLSQSMRLIVYPSGGTTSALPTRHSRHFWTGRLDVTAGRWSYV